MDRTVLVNEAVLNDIRHLVRNKMLMTPAEKQAFIRCIESGFGLVTPHVTKCLACGENIIIHLVEKKNERSTANSKR